MFSWLFARGKKEEAPPPAAGDGQTLSDIVRGIAHAAAAANEVSDMQMLKQMRDFFTLGEDGVLEAKMVRIRLNPTTHMDVPLVSMIDPSSLSLQDMKVRMSVRLSKAEVKRQLHAANDSVEVTRASFQVGLTGAKPGARKDVIDVTMTFKRLEPVEGSARVLEELGRGIAPSTANTPPPAATPLTESVAKTTTEYVVGEDESDEFPPAPTSG
jgi:hypothetical protein